MKKFSPKQMEVMNWWCPQSKGYGYDGIICDGAVRSGKTLCMTLSFFTWSMACFDKQNFAVCGKTISSVRRNVILPTQEILAQMGLKCREKVSRNYIEVSCKERKNRYYLFSGKDSSSAASIQGMTLAGVFFDEVALQNRDFVEQAVARCSVEGSRFWFNCNPEYPGHWFYTDWICRVKEKKLYYLHFQMDDNPSLSQKIKERYQTIYRGNFYDRFVLGKWVQPQGLIYPMFSHKIHVVERVPACSRFIVSCDYGTVNPCSIGLWGESNGVWYRLAEYYYDSRKQGICRTDEEHYMQLEQLCAGKQVEAVIVDPSAASFIECIRRHGRFRVIPARNQVLEGIELVSMLLQTGKLYFYRECKNAIREFSMYRWNDKSEREQPLKENDHAMDEIRYFAMQVLRPKKNGFFAIAQERKF